MYFKICANYTALVKARYRVISTFLVFIGGGHNNCFKRSPTAKPVPYESFTCLSHAPPCLTLCHRSTNGLPQPTRQYVTRAAAIKRSSACRGYPLLLSPSSYISRRLRASR